MKTYAQLIKEYRKSREREMISNGSHEHGRIIADNIFEAALSDKLDVSIITGTLRREFYEPLVPKLSRLLETNKVNLIVVDPEESELSGNKFLDCISSASNREIIINRDNSQNRRHQHFILAGDSMYRLETDHEMGLAVANFNDPIVGEMLRDRFESVLEEFLADKKPVESAG